MPAAKALRALLVLFVIGVACAPYAFAAGMTTSARQLGAGSAVVGACDDGIFSYAATVTGTGATTAVTHIVVNGISPTCQNSRLQLTVTDASNAALASGVVASLTNSGTVTVSLSSAVPAVQVAKVSVVVTGS